MQDWLDELVEQANSVLLFLKEEVDKDGSSVAPRSIRAIQNGVNARNKKYKIPDLSLPKVRGALVYLVLIEKSVEVAKTSGDWQYYASRNN